MTVIAVDPRVHEPPPGVSELHRPEALGDLLPRADFVIVTVPVLAGLLVRRLAPVFAANRHLADNISTLPLKAYRKIGDRREPMGNLPQLFQFLEDEGTLVDWLTRAVYSLAIFGNAIGFITNRDGFGFPTGVMWRPRSEFFVDDDSNPSRPQWYWNGRKVDREEFVHIPWLTVPGKTLGLSPLEAFALTVDSGLKAQEYGKDWFANGGVPPGTFKNSAKTLDAKASQIIRERLAATIRTKQPLVYGSDWDFNPIMIPTEQAQFVETQKLTANQIASIYGIAPEEIGHNKATEVALVGDGKAIMTQLNGEDAFQSFMNAYTAAIEPHTGYMNPRTAENFNMSMRLSLEGIGAVLQRQDEFIVVRSVVPGGPAGLSGKVKPGDRITAVGQGERGALADVVGWRIDDVVALIRGPKDSTVRLDIVPAEMSADAQPERIALVRQRVRLEEQAAKRSIIEIGEGEQARRIGVITLPTFYQDFEARRRNEADWRKLTTSDHFYYMCTKYWADGDVHKYFSPYDSPYDAYINFMNVLDNIRTRAGE
jgi:HK97 family phage portal protein